MTTEKRTADDLDVEPVAKKPLVNMDTVKADSVNKIYQLKHNVFRKNDDNTTSIICWCGVPCKLNKSTYVCGNRGNRAAKTCGVSYSKAALNFIIDHGFLHKPFEQSNMRYPDCPSCHQAQLILSTNTTFSTYGLPQWVCSCPRGERSYSMLTDCYRAANGLDTLKEMWDYDEIMRVHMSEKPVKKGAIRGGAVGNTVSWADTQTEHADEVV